MKKKILITGANGFIGSSVVDKALTLNYEVWAGVRATSNRQYLQDKNIKFIELDYSNKSNLKAQLQEINDTIGGFDYIVHLAGVTKAVSKSDFYHVNYFQFRNLVESLIETNSVPSLFVFMSTLGVLGLGDEINYTPFNQHSIPNPNTEYGKSKLEAENFLKGISEFPYLILRPTGVYGPRDRDYLILMRAVKSGLSVGAGFRKQLLSFIYIDDLTQIIFEAIDRGVSQKTYNVSDGYGYTDKEFNNLVKQNLGKRSLLRFKLPLSIVKIAARINGTIAKMSNKPTTFNSDKYWIMRQRNWMCDISELKKDLDFTPKYLLEEGVAKTVKWYKDNGWL